MKITGKLFQFKPFYFIIPYLYFKKNKLISNSLYCNGIYSRNSLDLRLSLERIDKK